MSEPAFICDPNNPLKDGMFMSVTWVSHGNGQVWTLDTQAFAPGVEAPSDNGVDVSRIYYSRSDGLWHEVG